ncbi:MULTISPECIES: DNA repair protein RadA [Okeania]|uniref:DNA repair protein RadA n=1 Tax=Okeania hirsuta TaxID=1458930 RepID=A0A3N6PG36_9CYAN|nr:MULTISPECIES: DNA repair protein RadA [Okeania]NET16938.1 DNA repair protein RadA [Okeania sp. SIO1H6]NES75996.1 DNA repair protein RadA [Okeania sp. SIO1H4]NES90680.1 DNA repair protein RadA [Okeania sp. SIO2B9]NET19552.1 DNA repair protein RadA [Okeania sp. SIO1H5]NET75746.1 DNA repair protein RadA [Okeania sp. SIO1F9]
MPKQKIKYVCGECGYESTQFLGKCPSCNTWNSFTEEIEKSTTAALQRLGLTDIGGSQASESDKSSGQPRASFLLSQISDQSLSRMPSGFEELDRVLGGGIVPGSLVLIGGEPGIGKSTLLLQVANQLSSRCRVLYVSAEESGQQVKLRSQRLIVNLNEVEQEDKDNVSNVEMDEDLSSNENQESNSNSETIKDSTTDSHENLFLLPETDLEVILRELESLKPYLAVIDSIQTIYFASLTSAPGSVAQVRECTSALMQVAKRENITLLIVGHVTKDGALAGPRVLEHLVDTVLYFEGDRFASHRLLRSMKNRFGATHEIGVFEMVANGLKEILNPSELFLGSRDEYSSGTSTVVSMEGTRPIVVEIQALVSPASHGAPRRSTTGIDSGRLQQILAVLEKRVGIPLSKLDTYVATVGGLSVEEPAADLGVAIAVVASFRDRVVDPRIILLGEVGLGGQVRPVSQLELRLREAAKLGFKRAIIPKGQQTPDLGMHILPIAKVIDAIIAAIPAQPLTMEN